MRVFWLNNEGGGYADYVDVAEGTTIDQFVKAQLPGRRPDDFLIRVNRQPVARDQVLQEGDRVTATPLKITGAVSV